MALTWTEILSDAPDIIGDAGPLTAAVNAYEAIPAANRKPSDLINLIATIMTTLGPLADKLVAQAKS